MKSRKIRLNILILLIFIMSFFFIYSAYKNKDIKPIEIYFLDVDQGDSSLVIMPNKSTILIDGAKSSQAEKILGYLRKFNIGKIDYIIATHPHSDHIGGLPHIMENIKVENIIFPNVVHTTKLYENFLETIKNKKINPIEAKKGLKINLGPSSIEILSPKKGGKYNNINNYSAVAKLSFGNNGVLFLADAEKEVEKDLVELGVKANIIKIGHHGSETSSSEEFLKFINPEVGIISVGQNNYGHPSEKVLNRYKNQNTKIYRTDRDGTILIKLYKNKFIIEKNI